MSLAHRQVQRRALVARLTGDRSPRALGTVAYAAALAERKAVAEAWQTERRDRQGRWTGNGSARWPIEPFQTAPNAIGSTNIRDAEEFANKAFDGYTSPAQDNALEYYEAAGYGSINNQLRGGTASPRVREHDAPMIEAIDAAISHCTAKRNMTVFRGIGWKVFANVEPGDEFIDKGFVSTSLRESVAKGVTLPDDVIVEIRVPKGTHALSYDQTGNTAERFHESEVLLPRGMHFRVIATHAPGHAFPKRSTERAQVVLEPVTNIPGKGMTRRDSGGSRRGKFIWGEGDLQWVKQRAGKMLRPSQRRKVEATQQRISRQLAEVGIKDYDPHEARDWHGRWTGTGSLLEIPVPPRAGLQNRTGLDEATVIANVVDAFDRNPTANEDAVWYETAHNQIQGWLDVLNIGVPPEDHVDPQTFAAVVAATSANNGWDSKPDPHGRKSYPNLRTAARCVLHYREFRDEAQRDPAGLANRLDSTKDLGGLVPAMTKGFRVLNGESPDEVLNGPKERSFYNDLSWPHNPHYVAVDRWAARVLTGELGPLTPNADKVVSTDASYLWAAQAYRKATAEINQRHGTNLPANAVQAVAWEQWRRDFIKPKRRRRPKLTT